MKILSENKVNKYFGTRLRCPDRCRCCWTPCCAPWARCSASPNWSRSWTVPGENCFCWECLCASCILWLWLWVFYKFTNVPPRSNIRKDNSQSDVFLAGTRHCATLWIMWHTSCLGYNVVIVNGGCVGVHVRWLLIVGQFVFLCARN